MAFEIKIPAGKEKSTGLAGAVGVSGNSAAEKKRIKAEEANTQEVENLTKGVALGNILAKGIMSLFDDVLKLFQPLLRLLSLLVFVAFLPLLPLITSLTQAIAEWIGDIFEKQNKPSTVGDVGTSPIGKQLEGSAGGFIGDLKKKFQDWINKIFDPSKFSGIFGQLFTMLAGLFVSGFGDVILGIMGVFGGLWDIVVGLVTGDLTLAIQGIVNVFKSIWDIFAGIVKMFFAFFAMIGAAFGQFYKMWIDMWNWIYNKIGEAFTLIWEFFKSIPEKFGSWLEKGLQGLLGIGKRISDWIMDKIKSIASKFSFGFGGGSKSDASVGDGVIQNGKIISTDPADTIMAFKDPSIFNKNKGNVTINVNNPVVRNDTDIKKLTQSISKELQKQGNRGFS